MNRRAWTDCVEGQIPTEAMEPGSFYLEEYGELLTDPRRHVIRTVPFRIGRSGQSDLVLASPQVSSAHAEIFLQDDVLWVRDLLSSNGTFCNGQRLADPVRLSEGDVLHFGGVECLVRRKAEEPTVDGTIIMPAFSRSPLTTHGEDAAALRELIDGALVTAAFQPIMDFGRSSFDRYELLGRGAHPRLPTSPGPLFGLSERHGVSRELSQLYRAEGLRLAQGLPGTPEVFMNTHPDESITEVLESLSRVKQELPGLRATLEVHESSVANADSMRELKAALDDMDMRLAYDDFGAGQARLLELVEVPPHYLKFDIALIRGIDAAPAPRRRLLATLVSMVRDLEIVCVAEGIETPGEYDVCVEMGFALGQGYLLGRPSPVEEWQGVAVV